MDRIRIKDIALLAGVSTGTVDRVLHNRGNVSEKAKIKVLKALETMDYSPNILASSLAYNKNWRIAVLMPNEIKDPFWNQPKEGILRAFKALKDYGVSIDFYHFHENDIEDFTANSKNILDNNYNAVIIAPIFLNQSLNFLNKCEEKNIPYVEFNTCLDLDAPNLLCYVGQDSYHSGTLGAKLLAFGLSPGEQVMICHLEELVYNSQHLIDKENGFKEYFSNHPSLEIEVFTGHYANPYDHEGLANFFEETLKKAPNIKGIFITTSRVFHAINALKKINRGNLKMVGFDLIEENLKYLESENIDFLINQNPHKQGYLALLNVFNFLARKMTPAKLQFLPLDVVMKENVDYYTDELFDEIPIIL